MPLNLVNLLLAGILGWIGGVLVNYLSDVLPYRRRLTAPFCLNCQARQGLINYFIWPRRCASCANRRSIRVWFVEALAVVAAVWLAISPPQGLGFFWGFVLILYFGTVVVIDLEHRLILHPVSLFGVGIGFIVGTLTHGLLKTVLGGVAGFSAMLAFYLLGELLVRLMYRLRGQAPEEVALGFGDVNLSAVLGLLLGWPAIIPGLFLAVLLGGAFSLVYVLILLITRRYHLFTAIPYGPFLVSAAVLLLYFRQGLLAPITP